MPINGATPMQYPFPYKTDDGLIQTSGSGGGGGSGVSSFSGDGQVLSNIASTGDVAATLATHPKNLVLASSATTDGQQPTFRALVAADLPGGGSTTQANLTLTDATDQVRFSDSGGVAELRQTGSTNPSFQLSGSDGLTNKSVLNTSQVKLTGTGTQFRATESTNSELDQVNVLNTNNGTSGASFLRANSNGRGLQVGVVNPGNKSSPNSPATTNGAGVLRTVSDVDGLDIITEGVSKRIKLVHDDTTNNTTFNPIICDQDGATSIASKTTTFIGSTVDAPNTGLGDVVCKVAPSGNFSISGTSSSSTATCSLRTDVNNYLNGYYINETVSNLYFIGDEEITTTLTYPQLNKTGTINISEITDPPSDTKNCVYNIRLPDPDSEGIQTGLTYTIYNGSASGSNNNILFIYNTGGSEILAGPILANMGTISTLMTRPNSFGLYWQTIPTYNNFAPRQYDALIQATEKDPRAPYQFVIIDPFLNTTFQTYNFYLRPETDSPNYTYFYVSLWHGNNVVDGTEVNVYNGSGNNCFFFINQDIYDPDRVTSNTVNGLGNATYKWNQTLGQWLLTYSTPFVSDTQKALNLLSTLLNASSVFLDPILNGSKILQYLGKGATTTQQLGAVIKTTEVATSGSSTSLNSLSNVESVVTDTEQAVEFAADSSIAAGTEVVNNWVVSGAYISPWKFNPLYIGP